jgi:hypothetical protein
MKRAVYLLHAIFFLMPLGLMGQNTEAKDSVSLKQGYEDRLWYSLSDGVQARVNQDKWDMAISVSGLSSAIRINSTTGSKLWAYPKGDTSQFGTAIDTAGLKDQWRQLYNTDTSWSIGAFNANADPGSSVDFGWGVYNRTSHHVVGDSFYVMKLGNGAFRQVWIERLASGTYTFHYADLDGQNGQTAEIRKDDYPNKAFAYYSLQNDKALDPAPAKSKWDLLFTQYTAFIPVPYSVTGVLQNAGVEAVKVDPVANPRSYEGYDEQAFKGAINTIGYDWKSLNRQERDYEMADSTVYFVKTSSENVWRLLFEDFGGRSNGNFKFYKQKVTSETTGVDQKGVDDKLFLKVHPNPVSRSIAEVTYSTARDVKEVKLLLRNTEGQIVQEANLQPGHLAQYTINTAGFEPGVYILQLRSDGQPQIQKLIIQ